MTDAPPKQNITKMALGGLIVTAIVLASAFAYHKGIFGNDFLAIEGSNITDEITVVLEERGKARPLPPVTKSGTIVYEAIENAPVRPYAIDITLQRDASYRDVRFAVNQNESVIVAEGFTPKGALSFAGQDDLHFDWSGRIELRQVLAALKGPLCFTADDISICHEIPKAAR